MTYWKPVFFHDAKRGFEIAEDCRIYTENFVNIAPNSGDNTG